MPVAQIESWVRGTPTGAGTVVNIPTGNVVIEEKVFDDSTVDGAASQLGLEVDANTARSLAITS